MKLETFFEKFDQFADGPDAVATIRELLIYFAVGGKLVPNDPREKSVALSLSGPPPEEIGLPSNWRCGLLGDAFTLEYGDNLPAPKRTETGKYPVYGSNGIVGTHDTYLTEEPAIIVGRKGSAGALNIANGPSWTTDVAYFVRPPKDLDLRFTYYLLSTLRLDELGKGIKPGLSRKEAYALSIALPPLAEQKRIVGKVDELMALCDRLEAQQQERQARHAALARASLGRFADAPSPDNLNLLFHKSYTIPPADLRKSILALAVQGKLVPQDSSDEPAVELIARIAQQRRTMKAKDYPPVDSSEAPFEAPYSWAWVRLGNISLSSDSGWSPQCSSESRTGNEWGVLKVSAVSWGGFDPEANKALPASEEARPESEVRPGDFLLSRANTEELVARSVVVEHTPPRLMMSDKIVRFTFPDEVEKTFINLANLSDPSRQYYMRNASGTSSSMKNIGREVMCNLPVAIPPLAEQRRIVAKVAQLMVLVDALETQLAASRATVAKLLSALVAEITGTPGNGKASVPSASGTGRRGRPRKS